MKNLYDVQQFLKRFGIIIYVGKRLYDIELTVLRREHKQELEFLKKSEVE